MLFLNVSLHCGRYLSSALRLAAAAKVFSRAAAVEEASSFFMPASVVPLGEQTARMKACGSYFVSAR